jgi:murein DD-endopeptidase MepM/ murein hydrolase activator NlpD
LKRAFLRKVKPVSCSPSTSHEMTEQSEQAPLGAKRRARTSAAMIGLALSMGASSLLLPRHNDSAKAAEPSGGEATASSVSQVATTPASTGSQLVAADSMPTVTMVDYVVREGQTLWQIAQKHQISVKTLAAVNGLKPNAMLTVGQTLKVPVSTRSLSDSQVSFSTLPKSTKADSNHAERLAASLDLSGLPASEGSVDKAGVLLKTERDTALSRLRQERDRLKGSLAGLKSGDTGNLSAVKSSAAANPLDSQARKEVAGVPQPQVSASSVLLSEAKSSVQPYQVQPGDTLSTIASAHRVSEQTLVAANHLPNPDWIRINQSLNIPTNLPASSAVSSPVHPLLSQALPQQEDSSAPSSVNLALSSTTAPVRADAVNGQAPVQSAVSQPEAVNPSTLVTYQVSPGDTAAEIARTHDISLSALIGANHLSDPNVIFVGQTLKVPSIPSTGASNAEKLVTPSTHSEAGVLVPSEQLISHATNAAQADSVVPQTTSSTIAARSAVPETESGANSLSVPTSLDPNRYVDGLLSEVRALREKHLHQAVDVASAQQQPTAVPAIASSTAPSAVPQPVAAATTALSAATARQTGEVAVNPEMNRARSVSQTPSNSANAQGNLVATASLGSENYAPLMQPLTGRMVSPDLPPLSNPDTYLPGQVFTGYIWPAKGMLTSGFGWRWGRMHQGIDIAADVGTPVYAAAMGVVEFAGWNSGGYGNMIDIRHADGSLTRYAHLSAIFVRQGQQINQSEQIAAMGSTGYSTGPHLHFEVHPKGEGAVNPIAFLPQQR